MGYFCFQSGAAGAAGAAGASHDSPRTPNAHFERSGASNTTKIPREDPQRSKKRTNFAAGEGKKSAKFWAPTVRPHPSGPPFGPPPFWSPLFLGLGPHPSGPHPSGLHPSGLHFFWVWAPGLHQKNQTIKNHKKTFKKKSKQLTQKIQTINKQKTI